MEGTELVASRIIASVGTARSNYIVMDLLLTHAEDQLMSAEAFGILAEKFVDLYKKLK